MSNQLPYRLEIDNRRAIVALLPELNEVPWADIETVGSEILSRLQTISTPSLLVDLCALNYMGSAQVALVVRLFKMVKERNGKMVVANRDPMVMEVLSLAGLNKVWTIVESRERAMSMLGGGGGGGGASYSGGGGGMQGGNSLPGTLALVAAFIAAIFIVLHLANPSLIPSRGDLIGALAGSAVAFLCGLWAMNSGQRNTGIGVLVVAMAILLFGVFELAKPAGHAPANSGEDAEPASATQKNDFESDSEILKNVQKQLEAAEAAKKAAANPDPVAPPVVTPPAATPPATTTPPAATPENSTPLKLGTEDK